MAASKIHGKSKVLVRAGTGTLSVAHIEYVLSRYTTGITVSGNVVNVHTNSIVSTKLVIE